MNRRSFLRLVGLGGAAAALPLPAAPVVMKPRVLSWTLSEAAPAPYRYGVSRVPFISEGHGVWRDAREAPERSDA